MKFGNLNIPPKGKKSEETPKEEQIVLVNPVLTAQAEGKTKAKPKQKEKAPRKSISEGGDMYVPKEFPESESWQVQAEVARKETPEVEGEATPAEEERARSDVYAMDREEPVVLDTKAEKLKALRDVIARTSDEDLETQITENRRRLESMEAFENAQGFKESNRFASHSVTRDSEGKITGREAVPVANDPHEDIARLESEVVAAEQELFKRRNPAEYMMRTAANDNEPSEAAEIAPETASNVVTFPPEKLAEWEARKAGREAAPQKSGEAVAEFKEVIAPALEEKIASEEKVVPFVAGTLLDKMFGRKGEAEKHKKGRKNMILAGLAALGLLTPPEELAASTTHNYDQLRAVSAQPQRQEAPRTPRATAERPREHIEIYSTPTSATGEGMTPASEAAMATRQSVIVRAHPGERADRLFARLQAELRAQYPRTEDAPDAVTREILSRTPHELARALRFENATSEAIMHGGTSLDMSYNGQLVFFSPGRSSILMEATRPSAEYPNGVHVVDTFHGRLTPKTTTEQPRAARVAPQRTASALRAPRAPRVDREAEGTREQQALERYETTPNPGETHGRGLPGEGTEEFAEVLRNIREQVRSSSDAPPPIVLRRAPATSQRQAPPPAPAEVRAAPARIAAEAPAPPPQAPSAPRTTPESGMPAAPVVSQAPAEASPQVSRAEVQPGGARIRPEVRQTASGPQTLLWSVDGTFEERFNKAQDYARSHRNVSVYFDSSPDGAPGTSVGAFIVGGDGIVHALDRVTDPVTGQPLTVPPAERLGSDVE